MRQFWKKKKVKWTGIAILIAFCLIVGSMCTLNRQSKAIPDNPIIGMNVQASQEPVTGKGSVDDSGQKEEQAEQSDNREQKKAQPQKRQDQQAARTIVKRVDTFL